MTFVLMYYLKMYVLRSYRWIVHNDNQNDLTAGNMWLTAVNYFQNYFSNILRAENVCRLKNNILVIGTIYP